MSDLSADPRSPVAPEDTTVAPTAPPEQKQGRFELSPLNKRRWRNFRANGRAFWSLVIFCLLYTSPSPRDGLLSRMPSSA